MGKLTVAEAVSKGVFRLFRILRGVMVLGCGIFVLLFVQKEKGILEEYQEIRTYLDRMEEYGHILEQAKECYAGGKLAESEKLYQMIFSEHLSDPEPYLGLADIYCDSKLYEKAVEVLEAFPKGIENQEISRRLQEIKDRIRILEQSLFGPVEKSGESKSVEQENVK